MARADVGCARHPTHSAPGRAGPDRPQLRRPRPATTCWPSPTSGTRCRAGAWPGPRSSPMPWPTAWASPCSRAPPCATASTRAGASPPRSSRGSCSPTRSPSGWGCSRSAASASWRAPFPAPTSSRRTQLVAPVGWLLLLTSVAYLVAVLVRREPIRVWRLELPLPSPRIGFAQLGVSALDWALAAAVLYVLLPTSDLSFLGLLGAFLAAQLLGLASHVPGGVGVFEGLDGAPAQALPLVRAAPAGAGRLPRGLLPVAAGDGARGPRRRRAAPAPRASRARGGLSRLAQRGDHAARPGRLHVPGRGGPALLGRHAGRAGPPRLARQPPAPRRDRGLALPRQHRRRGPAARVAGAFAAPRRRVLPGRGRDRARHRGVAPQGGRLRGGHAAGPAARGPVARAARLRSPGGALRRAVLDRLDRGGRGDAGRFGLAGPLRLQARRVLPRAVVAVRAGAGGLALPARVGGGGRGAGPVRLRPADAPRPARGHRAHGRRSRGRRPP